MIDHYVNDVVSLFLNLAKQFCHLLKLFCSINKCITILFLVASLTKDETTPVNDHYIIRDHNNLSGIKSLIKDLSPPKEKIIFENAYVIN